MRKLILVAVILQLVITLTDQYKFGDIISFTRQCKSKTYKHFAVYVGNGIDVGQEKHDIFQRTGPVLRLLPPSLSDCIFDDLKKEEENSQNIKIELDNYLDGIPDFEVGTDEAMAARIKEKLHKCGTYFPIGNNCEHVATYVRYNQKISLQMGVSSHFCLTNKALCEKVKAKEKEIQDGINAQHECETQKDTSKDSG